MANEIQASLATEHSVEVLGHMVQPMLASQVIVNEVNGPETLGQSCARVIGMMLGEGYWWLLQFNQQHNISTRINESTAQIKAAIKVKTLLSIYIHI